MNRFLLMIFLLHGAMGFSQSAFVDMNRIDAPSGHEKEGKVSFLSLNTYAESKGFDTHVTFSKHSSLESSLVSSNISKNDHNKNDEVCSEENPADSTFEDAFNCSSVSVLKTANDLTVPANEDFTLENITANIVANGGITRVDVTYYMNNQQTNLPGEIIGAEASVTISDQTVVGNAFGLSINQVELSVSPFTFFGKSGIPTTYWIELSVTDGGSTGAVFWSVTSSNMQGNPAAQSENGWVLNSDGKDGVYIWEGSCGPMTNGNYDVCTQGNPNDFAFDYGYNCASTSPYRAANDLTVAANENFILRNITASIFANGGIANVDVIYYDNDEETNLPGSIIGSENAVQIESQVVIGNNFGYNVNEIELAVTPFTFSGQDDVTTTYWIELSVTDGSASQFVYWVVTESSMSGFPLAGLDGNWSFPEQNMDGVHIWGSCESNADNDCLNYIAYGAADVSTSGTKQISVCQNQDEYSTITGVVAGYEYEFANFANISSEVSYITVRTGTFDGPVLSQGWSPLNVVAESNDTLFVHWNADENCGTDSECITTTATCITCDGSLPYEEYFVTTWKTTSADESITIPTTGSGYDYLVEWGDGNVDTGISGDATHIYAEAGIYTVKIHGNFPRIYFNNSGDKNKIQTIEQWGAINWTSMNSAFMGASNLVSNVTDIPNLSMVTDMYGMFSYATAFNGDSNMGNWNVGSVTNMHGMFGGAYSFNADIGNWDVSNVVNMKMMFAHAWAFNQDIGNWNVGAVRNMDSMFRVASMFDQDLGGWNVSNVANMNNMFKDVTLSIANYDALLNGWNSLTLKNNVKFHGGKSKYCNGEVARQNIMATYNWTIVDGGTDCGTEEAKSEANNDLLISFYPNPMRNELILGNPTNMKLANASVFDLSGRIIKTVDLTGMSTEMTVDVSNLSRATYLFVLTAENGSQISKLLIKE